MNGGDDDPVLRPFKSVVELIRLAVSSGWRSVMSPFNNAWRAGRRMLVVRWNRRWGRKRLEGGEMPA